jgi:hypothetical protein
MPPNRIPRKAALESCASWISEGLAHNGLASERPERKFLLGFGAALGGLCALEELAHNGLASERPEGKFLLGFGAALGGLCASKAGC